MVLDAVDDVGDDDLGFDEIVVYTEGLGAFFVAVLAEGGQHDDLEVGGLGRVAKDVEDIETADFGHHDVEDDEVGVIIEGGS